MEYTEKDHDEITREIEKSDEIINTLKHYIDFHTERINEYETSVTDIKSFLTPENLHILSQEQQDRVRKSVEDGEAETLRDITETKAIINQYKEQIKNTQAHRDTISERQEGIRISYKKLKEERYASDARKNKTSLLKYKNINLKEKIKQRDRDIERIREKITEYDEYRKNLGPVTVASCQRKLGRDLRAREKIPWQFLFIPYYYALGPMYKEEGENEVESGVYLQKKFISVQDTKFWVFINKSSRQYQKKGKNY